MRVQQAKVTASCWGSMSSVVAMFLFLSPCLFTALPAVNRSHSAEAFLSVCVALCQQLPLDGGERVACQGQSCALISVHRWTARLTPVPFAPKAPWYYICVRVVFSVMFVPALSLPLQKPAVWDWLCSTYLLYHTLDLIRMGPLYVTSGGWGRKRWREDGCGIEH